MEFDRSRTQGLKQIRVHLIARSSYLLYLVLLFLLASPVAGGGVDFYDPTDWTEIPKHYPYKTTIEGTEIIYPYTPDHDKRLLRKNHLNWRDGADHANCLHVKPGHHKPNSPIASYLGQNCTDYLHKKDEFGGEYWANCFPNAPTPASEAPYQLFMVTDKWDNQEHCRAGCETCFDAMEEYGAEQAYCVRTKLQAQCHMGIMKPTEMKRWNSERFKDRHVYYATGETIHIPPDFRWTVHDIHHWPLPYRGILFHDDGVIAHPEPKTAQEAYNIQAKYGRGK